jgi:hypothetical protein
VSVPGLTVWNLVEFHSLYDSSDADQHGPFGSVRSAQDFAATQASQGLNWHERKMAEDALPYWEALLGAEAAGGPVRYRIMPALLFAGDPEFDKAVLRFAAEILKARFGVITCESEIKALRSAATDIEERRSR